MKVSFNSGFNIWPFGYWQNYALECPLKPNDLSLIIDACLNQLVSNSIFKQGAEYINFKGRDPQSLLIEKIDAGFAPHGQELCFIGGEVLNSSDQSRDGEASDRFQVSINSKFRDFPNNKDIRYEGVEVRRGGVPAFLETTEMGRAISLKPSIFRLGMEFFKPKMLYVLGINPAVTEALLIDALPEQFKLTISADSLKTKSALPLQPLEIFEKLSALTVKLFQFDLKSDYLARL